MDMTILYASVLESIDLHPLLFCQKGHIFCGAWLEEKAFDQIIVSDLGEILKRTNHSDAEITFVECTKMCTHSDLSFEKAERLALDHKIRNAKSLSAFIILYENMASLKKLLRDHV